MAVSVEDAGETGLHSNSNFHSFTAAIDLYISYYCPAKFKPLRNSITHHLKHTQEIINKIFLNKHT